MRAASGRAAYLLALGLGLALAWWVFPRGFVLPAAGESLPGGDASQHIIGQRYFIAEPWGWPLLLARGLVAPEGTNIAFVDAIPLLALLLKLLAPWLPPGFHGIGLWYALAWVLQPVAAVFCLRSAGERRWLPALCLAALACAMPAWWNRFGHAALSGHFLLLLALGLYFRLVRQDAPWPWRLWLAAAALCAALLLVHPYLLLMGLAVLGAAPATLLLRRLAGVPQAGWVRAALGLGGCLAVVALLVRGLGYLGAGGPGGYGVFAMNLLSPVWPNSSGLLGPQRWPAAVDAAGYSGWEGYNWLGFGLLGGLAAGLLFRPRAALAGLRHHAGLVAALLCLTLLALSFQVGWGNRVVLDLGTPPDALQQFRASGRLFWPVGYALALAAVLLLARLRPAPLRVAALAAVALVQWADAAPLRERLEANAARPAAAPRPEVLALREALAAGEVTRLTLLPGWNCLPAEQAAQLRVLMLDLLAMASERATPVNTMYLARWTRPEVCADEASAAVLPLRAGELRVLLLPAEWRDRVPEAGRFCRAVGRLAFCFAPGGAAAPLPDGGLSFRAGEAGLGLLDGGWSGPEPWGTWSEGPEAALVLPPAAAGRARRRLGLRVTGFAPGPGGRQGVTVLLDGRKLAEWKLPEATPELHWLDLPPGAVRLVFRFDAPVSPEVRGLSADRRRIAMGLISVEEAAP
jgi:hypothetical protein